MKRIATEYNARLLLEASRLRPDLLFVFKGAFVTADSLRAIRAMGTVALQFYPDVSFRTHGPWLPDALREYDWVFTTKTFGLHDMATQLDIRNASFLPHGFDPETHRPHPVSQKDREQYGCDISFIGDWSPKKEQILRRVASSVPDADLRIWGPPRWLGRHPCYQGQPVLGIEYAKAISLSRINIGLLSEQRTGATDGDRITSRTFHIPASGGFLLHERTDEVLEIFDEGREIACFSDTDELIRKIRYFLEHDSERRKAADAGQSRCTASGYSVDDRVRTVLAKYYKLRGASSMVAA